MKNTIHSIFLIVALSVMSMGCIDEHAGTVNLQKMQDIPINPIAV